jgi:hypothetical protein
VRFARRYPAASDREGPFVRWVADLSHLQRMMFERSSPSRHSRKILRKRERSPADVLSTGCGSPSILLDAVGRNPNVIDHCDASAITQPMRDEVRRVVSKTCSIDGRAI